MKWLVIESWILLLYVEFIMLFRSFKTLLQTVRRAKIQPTEKCMHSLSGDLNRAMDMACVFYFKRVMCLQRSAATTILLRRYGQKAEMAIGVQILPFKSHAWVEIGGAVMNDKPYVLDTYQVLER
jgi:hypothetical protein